MAIQTSARTGDPEKLNELWDSLGADFDQYYNTISSSAQKSIQRAITKWQDWFYGNYGEWGPLDQWIDTYNNAYNLLKAEKARGIKKEKVVDLPPETKAREMEPIYIYGKAPKFEVDEEKDPFAEAKKKVGDFPWGILAIGALGVILAARYAK